MRLSRGIAGFFVYDAGKKDFVFSVFVLALCISLAVLPSGFEDRMPEASLKVEGEVLEADNSGMAQHGLVRTGGQMLRVRLLEGPFAGEVVTAYNNLLSKMELDKVFQPGDHALMNISVQGNSVVWAGAADHYRLRAEGVLAGIFLLFLLLYGGFTGLRAAISFIFTALCLWKLLVPLLLKGYDPIAVTFAITATLTAVTIFLVAGVNRKGLVAFLGALAGLAFTCCLALAFSGPLHVNGAVRPFSETLLFSGFMHLNLTRIFLAGIFLAASGAVMDLAIDIALALHEIARHNPAISRLELLKSGVIVGRAVIGGMTTTLALAYSGGYLTLLMLFMGQGVPMQNILNLSYVSAELLHILAGSFGLVLVAPLTAVIGCVAYARPR
ncbi:MAG: YibE/F family protein [Deltaproteobacteria bacterium]|jgi:uncharacterized membrane protein|nr:YibE/F family protein [Deltaproteobacteria bacterium]